MKPSKVEVLKEMIRVAISFESEGVVGIGIIAERLGTSKYHVRKHVKTLLEEGYLKKGIRKGGFNDDYTPYPPLKGYEITNKTRETELFKQVRNEVTRIPLPW